MKKNVYLHIGMFKTGSTAIQDFLRDERGSFLQQGYYIPEGEIADQHHLPQSLMIEHAGIYLAGWLPKSHDASFYWNLLAEQMKNTKCKNIIISSEFFCDFMHPDAKSHADFFSNFLKNFFMEYNVKIICYIRNIFAYLKSMYGQIIKIGGSAYSFSDVMRGSIYGKSFHAFPKQVLDFYTNIFGKNSLIIRKYDKDNLYDMDIVCDFLNVLSINIDHKKYSTVNMSLPEKYIPLKRLFNLLQFVDVNFNNYISDILIKQKMKDPEPLDYSELIKGAQDIKNEYHIDILDDETECKYEETPCSDTESFIIILISLLIKQNREILYRLSKSDNLINNK